MENPQNVEFTSQEIMQVIQILDRADVKVSESTLVAILRDKLTRFGMQLNQKEQSQAVVKKVAEDIDKDSKKKK